MELLYPLIQEQDRGTFIVLENILPAYKCDIVNEMAGKLDSVDGTITVDQKVDDKIRKSEIRWLDWPNQNSDFKDVYELVQEIIIDINVKHFRYDIHGIGEQIQHATYYGGEGHYDWHMDVGPHRQSIRKFSMTLLLDDPKDYEGGEMEFLIGSKPQMAPLQKGSAVLFPSYFLHKVNPVTKGVRRSLVVWVTGPPYK